jgi:hypothetical protein
MATEFHEGDKHGHLPIGRWPEIQKNPDSVAWAKARIFYNPLALRHINWYLNHKGADFIEDVALKLVLENDKGVQSAIARRLPAAKSSGKVCDYFKLEQRHYGLDDARSAWGAIDRLDYEADYDAGTLHVWFRDRYEWHPYYPTLYTDVQDGDGPPPRETNCLHAAFVEMKSQGAADFWMQGEATVPLKPVVKCVSTNLPDW